MINKRKFVFENFFRVFVFFFLVFEYFPIHKYILGVIF